jgi:methionyl aminopeptidase
MTIQSASDLHGMRTVGKLVAEALRVMRAAAQPNMTTAQLDDVGAAYLRARGARSAPQLTYDFPGFNCISVNDEVVHGVPGPRVLMPGDVVKIDVTAELDGYIADAAITVPLPPVSTRAHNLTECARARRSSTPSKRPCRKRASRTSAARSKTKSTAGTIRSSASCAGMV